MIKYDLKCRYEHVFEGWFPSSEGFEKQAKDGLISCPVCGDIQVNRALMAPAIKKISNKELSNKDVPVKVKEAELYAKLRTLRTQIEKNTEDVGDRFADEARSIYLGKSEERAIRGKTSDEEAADLEEEGVPFVKVPWVDKSDN